MDYNLDSRLCIISLPAPDALHINTIQSNPFYDLKFPTLDEVKILQVTDR